MNGFLSKSKPLGWFLACVLLESFIKFLVDPYYEPLSWFMIYIYIYRYRYRYKYLLVGLAGFETFWTQPADQVVCSTGQTGGHSSPWPYYKLSRHKVEQNWTSNYPIMPFSSVIGSVLVLHDLIGSAKADLHI